MRLLSSILLSLPIVQTKLGKYATTKINEDFNVDIKIKKIDLSFLGSLDLKGIEINGVQGFADTIQFVISARAIKPVGFTLSNPNT